MEPSERSIDFFSLPEEIRQYIYRLVFEDSRIFVRVIKDSMGQDFVPHIRLEVNRACQLDLLRTSSVMYHEMMPVLFSCTSIWPYHDVQDLGWAICQIPAEYRQHITIIQHYRELDKPFVWECLPSLRTFRRSQGYLCMREFGKPEYGSMSADEVIMLELKNTDMWTTRERDHRMFTPSPTFKVILRTKYSALGPSRDGSATTLVVDVETGPGQWKLVNKYITEIHHGEFYRYALDEKIWQSFLAKARQLTSEAH